jgi:heat shock protein HslJ
VRILTLLCLLFLCGFLGQAQSSRQLSTDNRSLVGREWRLVSMGPVGNETDVIPGTRPTLSFGEDRRASGSTGCNSFSGTYEVNGDRISFGRLVSTRRACLDQRANQQEQRYLSALESANRFRIIANRLTLNAGTRSALNFVEADDSPSTPADPQPNESDPIAALTSYYNAINERNYEEAYRYWETPATNFDRFVRGFADTRRSRLLIEPPVRIEGAAGSLYAQMPVIVVAEMRNGNERFFAGCYTMRRMNQPGGTWRIYRATVAQVSAANALRQRISENCVR